MPLSPGVVEAWLHETAKPRVGDVIRNETTSRTFEELRDKAVLTSGWWGKRVSEWLKDYGVSVEVTAQRLESAEADRAEADRQQQKMLKILEQQR